jgi:elongation factor 3
MVAKLNFAAIKVVLPHLLEVMEPKVKWQTKMGALSMLSTLADSSKETLSACLPEIVPAVTECMVDIKKELRDAATEALVKCCGAVGNRDIEPFIPNLVRCIAQPEEVQDCVHKLASTTFVQAVDAKTLALLVPLLVRGLAERSTPIRRKTCVIIDNMAKLVDDPIDAAEFAALLRPGVDKVLKEMSNPEARSVAEKALATLDFVAVEAAKNGATGQPGAKVDRAALRDALAKAVADASGAALGPDAEATLSYAADMCATLADVRNFDDDAWAACVVPYLGSYVTEASATKAAAAFLVVCFREAESKGGVVDEEEGEDLCNCEFSLAYGAKVLLMNATLHLKRGQRYGLCGPNGAGKSTLMRAIVNGQLDGFPPKDQLRTVYVEHDIDASQADVSSPCCSRTEPPAAPAQRAPGGPLPARARRPRPPHPAPALLPLRPPSADSSLSLLRLPPPRPPPPCRPPSSSSSSPTPPWRAPSARRWRRCSPRWASPPRCPPAPWPRCRAGGR